MIRVIEHARYKIAVRIMSPVHALLSGEADLSCVDVLPAA